MTVWYDRHRLAEVQADIDGHPYETDDPRWSIGKATFAASLRDPEIARANQSLGSLLVTSSELFAEPGLVDRVMRLGSGAPTYPIPVPTAASCSRSWPASSRERRCASRSMTSR
jgi:hypothetical protein